MQTITHGFFVLPPLIHALRIIFAIFLFAPASISQAKECELSFVTQTERTMALVQPDAYRQWIIWEETANVPQFQKPTTPVQIKVVEAESFATIFEATEGLPQRLRNFFVRGEEVNWLEHPFNTSESVPFSDRTVIGTISAYMTASRSLVLADESLRGFSVKLPTDHPHGTHGPTEPGKLKTNEDVVVAMARTKHINSVDRILGNDSKTIILPEVMTLSEKESRIGMVIRDLRPLDDGNYYFPAFSIPWLGREIAAHNGKSFEDFWQKHYGELLGEAKAHLLLRYGLQMQTPNSQNMLIQLDRNLRPTGKLVFRDVVDALFVDAVATGRGFAEPMAKDRAVNTLPVSLIAPYWTNSVWGFEFAGDKGVERTTLYAWGMAHNRAYARVLSNELGLKFEFDIPENVAYDIYSLLASTAGQTALRAYTARGGRSLQIGPASSDLPEVSGF